MKKGLHVLWVVAAVIATLSVGGELYAYLFADWQPTRYDIIWNLSMLLLLFISTVCNAAVETLKVFGYKDEEEAAE